jgi:hypothetical protein
MQPQLPGDGTIRPAFTVKFDHLLITFQSAGSSFLFDRLAASDVDRTRRTGSPRNLRRRMWF